jgi:hypothetical protein
MSQIFSNKISVYSPASGLGHHVAFTTVDAGNMSTTVLPGDATAQDSEHNRRAIEETLGIPPGTTRFVSQVHSARVLDAGQRGWAEQDALEEADGLVSTEGHDPIAILVADCLPVAFTTDFGPSAVAHAGRVGLLGGILQNTVKRLRQLDAHSDGTIQATIGPSICAKCYEVPAEMRHQAAQQHPAIAAETSWGTPALDLPAAAEAILASLNVEVNRTDQCTYTNEQYYSHRRQPGAGRIAAFVWKDRKSIW